MSQKIQQTLNENEQNEIQDSVEEDSEMIECGETETGDKEDIEFEVDDENEEIASEDEEDNEDKDDEDSGIEILQLINFEELLLSSDNDLTEQSAEDDRQLQALISETVEAFEEFQEMASTVVNDRNFVGSSRAILDKKKLITKEAVESLEKAQIMFNDLIDVYNGTKVLIEQTRTANRNVSETYKIKNQDFEKWREERSTKVEETSQQMGQIKHAIEEHRKTIVSHHDLLSKKSEFLDKSRLERLSLESDLNAYEIETLTKQLAGANLRKNDKTADFDDQSDKMQAADSTLEAQKESLKSLKEEIKLYEQKIHKEKEEKTVCLQRFENEKQIVGQFMQSKLKRQIQRIEKGNVNITSEIQGKVKKLKAMEQSVAAVNDEIQKISVSVKNCESKKETTLKAIVQFKKNMKNMPTKNVDHKNQKVKLKSAIKAVKQKSSLSKKQTKSKVKKLEKLIEKEHRRQTLLKSVEESSSEQNEDGSESILSSLSSSKVESDLIEKVNQNESVEVSKYLKNL